MKCPECDTENPDDALSCVQCGAGLEEAREVQALIGTTIADRYRITRVIGVGGMGVVYEAEQQLGPHVRQVALKTLHPALARDATVVSRFHRECGVVASLEHPNTIKFYDFGQTEEGLLYIVMELVRGESLTDAIAAGLSMERSLGILRQVCGALHEAHERGIVHRDLKPDNVILNVERQDFVKVLDFGIAARVGAGTKVETKLTQQGTVLGTPPYMSPEQFMGKELDRTSDVYALGVIAYEMFSGRLPFTADSPFEWAVRHMTAPPDPPPATLPEPLRRALLRALEKEPAARQPTAIAFFESLEGAASDAIALGRESTEPESRQLTTEDRRQAEAVRTQPVGAWTPPVSEAPEPFRPADPGPIRVPDPMPTARATSTGTTPWRGVRWILALLLVAGGVVGGFFVWRRGNVGPPVPPLPTRTSAQPDASPPVSLLPEVDASDQLAPFSPTSSPANPPSPHPPPHSPPSPPSPPVSAPPPASNIPFPFPIPTTLPIPTVPPPASTSPSAPPPPASTPSTSPSPPPASTAAADAACKQADTLARAQNIDGAVAAYNRCRTGGGSPRLQNIARERIRAEAASAARARAFLGDCPGAQHIVASASSIGAGDRAAKVVAGTSCGKR